MASGWLSLKDAAERVTTATREERVAMLTDLRHERAECVYRIEHAKARISVLEVLLARLPTPTPSPKP